MQMFLSVNGKLAGVFTLADELRADSMQAVARLKKQGYDIHLLSGRFRQVSAPVQSPHLAGSLFSVQLHVGNYLTPGRMLQLLGKVQRSETGRQKQDWVEGCCIHSLLLRASAIQGA